MVDLVDLFVFFLLSLIFWSLMGVYHPLPLGGGFLGVSCLAVVVVCFNIGIFPAFAVWVVFIGGVLVVFAYSFSLVPFNRSGLQEEEEGAVKEMFPKNKWNGVFSFFGDVCLSMLVILVFIGQSEKWSFLFRSESVYFSEGWSVVVVGLGCLLLMVMIGVVRITSKYSGALIK